MQFEPIPDTLCTLGESPVWDAEHGALLWSDIPEGVIHEWTLHGDRRRRWTLDGPVGSFGLARSGRLVVGCGAKVGMLDRSTGAFTVIAEIEPASAGTRLNDGKVGPDGAFWVGSMDDSGQKRPIGTLYRVAADGTVARKVEGLTTANGLAWSPEGHLMFHSDSRSQWIDRWRFDAATGAIDGRTRIATPDDAAGRPDGGATDTDGFYWSAGVSAGCLNRYTPDGALVARFELPVPRPTMPCFGGRDLKTLFVTSLRQGLSAEDLARAPLAGSILTARAAVAGTPVGRFAD
jgi:sugar lactone lactonase YvrE